MARAFLTELDELIRARYPLIYLVTWEEERALRFLGSVASKQRKALFEWRITDGLRRIDGDASSSSSNPKARAPMDVLKDILQRDLDAIFVLKDFHPHLESPEVARQLRDLASTLRRSRKTVVLLAPVLNVPMELEKSVTVLDMPLPTYEEIERLLVERVLQPSRSYTSNLSKADQDKMVKAALGLTYTEAENAFARAIVKDRKFGPDDVAVVAAEKRQIIRKTELLEYFDEPESFDNVGGMDLLKDWLLKRTRAFGPEAREYGLPEPRGILLMGVQGCGKSLIAKGIAAQWSLPLLRMDMSRIYREYIGSSEQNMRRAIAIAEGIAPVVLWIDEIEKAFAGSQGDNDTGTAARVLGIFLTWLQEKDAPVFVVATANDISGLPPEMLRKGRLDEVFFVDLPTAAERREIAAIHVRRIKRDPAMFDLDGIAEATEGFSGAEIEQAVVAGLHDSFFEERELKTDDIVRNAKATVPLSRTMREHIDALRAWSRDRARPVTSADDMRMKSRD